MRQLNLTEQNLPPMLQFRLLSLLNMVRLREYARVIGVSSKGKRKAALVRDMVKSGKVSMDLGFRIGVKAKGHNQLERGENPDIKHYLEQSAWAEQCEIVEDEVPLKQGRSIRPTEV